MTQARTGNEQRIVSLEAQLVDLRNSLEAVRDWMQIHGPEAVLAGSLLANGLEQLLSSSAEYAGKVVVDESVLDSHVENVELRKKLKRLGSVEALHLPFTMPQLDVDEIADELRLRIDYARDSLDGIKDNCKGKVVVDREELNDTCDVLEAASNALQTLPEDILGFGSDLDSEWPLRDEMITSLNFHRSRLDSLRKQGAVEQCKVCGSTENIERGLCDDHENLSQADLSP